MFIVRLKTYLERWMKLAEAPQTYEALRDLLVKVQFLNSSLADLSTYLRERKLADLEEVARSAKLFLTAHKRLLNDRARQGATHGQKKLQFSRRKNNSYVTFVKSLVTLRRIVEIKLLEVEGVITVES